MIFIFQRQLDMLPGLIVDRMNNAQFERPLDPRPFPDFRSISRLSPPRRRRYIPPSQPPNSAPQPSTQADTNSSGPI